MRRNKSGGSQGKKATQPVAQQVAESESTIRDEEREDAHMSTTNQSSKPKRMTIADLNSRLTEFMNSVRARFDSIDESMNEMKRNQERISDLERQVKAMNDQRQSSSDPAPAPATPVSNDETTTSTTDRTRGRNNMNDYLLERVPVRRVFLILMAIVLAASILALAMGSHYTSIPEKTTTVQSERGSIAINGNVTFHVYQDRADTNKSDEANAESETVVLLTRPLIEMNYNPDGSAETIITN